MNGNKIIEKTNNFLDTIDELTYAIEKNEEQKAMALLQKVIFYYGISLGELSYFYHKYEQEKGKENESKSNC